MSVCVYIPYTYTYVQFTSCSCVCVCVSLSLSPTPPRTDKSWRSSYNTNIYIHQYLISRWLQ